ncbi:DUF2913 family protein (plasmid) [Vibrio harveyi]|uniref:DUF2913 family protein n=1 Tax=Vibrio harveyi TaxID=669 RepID=UPI00247FE8E1|nr:DUF2913 family protein [Vibrio harveyi]
MSTICPIQREIVVHALLHVAFYRASIQPKFLPVKSCNELLVKWLKPKLKCNSNKTAKKLIKDLIKKGRDASFNLENYMWKLNVSGKPVVQSDLDEFILLVNEIESAWKSEFKLLEKKKFDTNKEVTDTGLYLLTDDIASHFDQTNNQLCKAIQIIYKGGQNQQALLEKLFKLSVFNISEAEETANGFSIINISARLSM